MIIGQGRSQTIIVLSLCALLVLATVSLIAMAAVDRAGDIEHAVAKMLGRDGPHGPVLKNEPAEWFGTDDYPGEALRRQEEGLVAIRLDIDEGGQVTDCTVTTSSGSAVLDRTTCSLARERARFGPARAKDGTPIRSALKRRVIWKIPAADPIRDSRIALGGSESDPICALVVEGHARRLRDEVCRSLDKAARLPDGSRAKSAVAGLPDLANMLQPE